MWFLIVNTYIECTYHWRKKVFSIMWCLNIIWIDRWRPLFSVSFICLLNSHNSEFLLFSPLEKCKMLEGVCFYHRLRVMLIFNFDLKVIYCNDYLLKTVELWVSSYWLILPVGLFARFQFYLILKILQLIFSRVFERL